MWLLAFFSYLHKEETVLSKALLMLSTVLLLIVFMVTAFLGFVFNNIQTTQRQINEQQVALFELETMSFVAASEAKRSERIEAEFIELTELVVRQQSMMKLMSAQMKNLAEIVTLSGAHIRACHEIMHDHQVPVPATGLAPGEMDELPENLQEEFEFEIEIVPADDADELPQFEIELKSVDKTA